MVKHLSLRPLKNRTDPLCDGTVFVTFDAFEGIIWFTIIIKLKFKIHL